MQRQATVALPKKPIFYGWVIIAVAGLLGFAGGTPTFPVLGLFLRPMTEELGWTRAAYALPLTIGTLLGGFAGALTGPAMDRYGPRWIVIAAAVVVGGCFILMGFVHELWQHFVLGITIRTFTAGVFFMVGGVVIPRWFVIKRGRAAALAGLGGSLGQFSNPIMVQTVMGALGWRAAWASLGIIVWVLVIVPVFLFLKNKPEDIGLLPDGVTQEEAARMKAEAQANQGKPGPRKKSIEEVSFTAKEAVRTRAFWLMLIAQTAIALVISGLHLHWFSYMTSKGLPQGVAVASISVSSLASVPAALFGGYLAERVPLRYVQMACYLGLGVAVTLLMFTDTPIMAYAYGILLGAFSAVAFTTGMVAWADYYGRKNMGAIRGMTSPISQITNASGPLVGSLIFDATGSYVLLLVLFIGISVVSSLCWVAAVQPKKPVEVVAS
jgi:MFS family permease